MTRLLFLHRRLTRTALRRRAESRPWPLSRSAVVLVAPPSPGRCGLLLDLDLGLSFGLGLGDGLLGVGAVLVQQIEDLLAHVEVAPTARQAPCRQPAVAGHGEDRLGAAVQELGHLGDREEVVVHEGSLYAGTWLLRATLPRQRLLLLLIGN
jgi:hypothetical protein